MDRRSFFKFASFSGAMTAFLGGLHPALALTWQKIGTTSGGAGKWNKITLTSGGASTIGIASLAAGDSHSLVLRSDGLVFGCGYNYQGQLGNNTSNANTSTHVQALGVSNVVALAAGVYHSLALRSDGLVFACGYNRGRSNAITGQLGDNSSVAKSTYVQAVGVSNVMALAAGQSHSLALRSDGLVFGCGYNGYGQLGINNNVHKSTYVQALGVSNIVALAAGTFHSLALRSDGLVFASGCNVSGQLGNNSTLNKSTYVQAVGISNVVALAAGTDHSLALRSDGLVFACGYNGNGSLGNNTNVNKSTYIKAVGISNVVALAAGIAHSLALRSDGLVFGCGYNLYGQLADNSGDIFGRGINKSTYVQAVGVSNVMALAAGQSHSLALRTDGQLFACGYNAYGQLVDNSTLIKITYVQAVSPQ